MLARLVLAAALACIATPGMALEVSPWPPSEAAAARMRELQQVLGARESTPAQREVAREELSGLLKSPAGQQRGRTADERPARAAIDPYPRMVKPVNIAPAPPAPAAGVAQVEVIEPPKGVINPRSGSVAAPAGRFAIDPRTGGVLHEAGAGFIDPRTGQFIPR